MRNFAKLTLLFCLSFLVIFLTSAAFRFLSLRVEWVRNLPPRPETFLTFIITASHWALSLTLFSSILFSLNYAARRNYFPLMTVICVTVLSAAFCFAVLTALENWESVPPAQSSAVPLGNKGIILSNSLNKNETAVILLNGTEDSLGPRVIAIPGQPLVFQETAAAGFDLPPVPFGDDTPWFLKSLSIDIRLNALLFQQKFSEGYIPFLIYSGSLIFLLCALGYAVKVSVWPLANLFLGILAFRGILAFEIFLTTPEMQEITGSFLKDAVPVSLALPLLFLGFAVMIFLYSILVFALKRRDNNDD